MIRGSSILGMRWLLAALLFAGAAQAQDKVNLTTTW